MNNSKGVVGVAPKVTVMPVKVCNSNFQYSVPEYPAAYKWVIGVGAVDSSGNRAPYSNYGDFVYLVAPGSSIISTWLGNKYAYATGTSMATPHVSGVAALYLSYNQSFTNLQVARHLLSNADDKGSTGRDPYYGFGLVDAYPWDG